MPKRTFQPKKKKAKRKHGFLTRMKSKDGRDMIARKRTKGKKKLGA